MKSSAPLFKPLIQANQKRFHSRMFKNYVCLKPTFFHYLVQGDDSLIPILCFVGKPIGLNFIGKGKDFALDEQVLMRVKGLTNGGINGNIFAGFDVFTVATYFWASWAVSRFWKKVFCSKCFYWNDEIMILKKWITIDDNNNSELNLIRNNVKTSIWNLFEHSAYLL